jgi:hypothetical protein
MLHTFLFITQRTLIVSEREKKEVSEDANAEGAPDSQSKKESLPEGYKLLSYFVSALLIFAGFVTMGSAWEISQIEISKELSKVSIIEFNHNQAEVLSRSRAQQDYTVYSYYNLDIDHAALLEDAIETADEDVAEKLTLQAEDATSRADYVNGFFFDKRYLREDGSYDVDRNRLEEFAEIGRGLDLDSDRALEEIEAMAERKREFMHAVRLLGQSMVILGFEKVFYWKRRIIRFPIIFAGVVMLLLGLMSYVANGPNPIGLFF